VTRTEVEGFVPKPSGIDTLVDSSLKKMLPDIKADMSLLNSIIELKDFASLPNTLRSISNVQDGLLPNLAAKILKNRKLFVGKGLKLSRRLRAIRLSFGKEVGSTLRETLQTTADAYLQTEFNVLPLLSDISAIFSALSRTQRALNDLIVRQGKRQDRHYVYTWYENGWNAPDKSATLSMSGGQFDGTISVPVGKTPLYKASAMTYRATRHVIQDQPSVFHAQIEYNFHFTQFQIENARLFALMDVLGVNLNPQIIWNAIPWSFVVDWVLGVSQWLGSRKVLNMEPVVNISRYLWSYKHSRKTLVELNSTGALNGFPMTHIDMPVLYEEAYRRDIGIPATNSFLTSELTSKEVTLGVALAITQRRRPHTRIR
jgi:hypothetical protein